MTQGLWIWMWDTSADPDHAFASPRLAAWNLTHVHEARQRLVYADWCVIIRTRPICNFWDSHRYQGVKVTLLIDYFVLIDSPDEVIKHFNTDYQWSSQMTAVRWNCSQAPNETQRTVVLDTYSQSQEAVCLCIRCLSARHGDLVFFSDRDLRSQRQQQRPNAASQ